MTKYFMVLVSLIFVVALFMILDGYLKTQYVKTHEEEFVDFLMLSKQKAESNFIKLPDPIDYRQDFSVFTSVYWLDLISIAFILSILQTWCFYFQINRAY